MDRTLTRSLAAALGGGVLVLAACGSDSGSISMPTVPLTTGAPATTIVSAPADTAETVATSEAPSSSADQNCGALDPAAPHAVDFVSLTETDAWTMSPLRCADGERAVTAFDLTRTSLADPARSTSWRVSVAALQTAVPGLAVRPAGFDPSIPWGDLRLAGVFGDSAFVRTENAVARLDMANQQIDGIVLPLLPGDAAYLPVTLLGDTVLVPGTPTLTPGSSSEPLGPVRVDFDTGALVPFVDAGPNSGYGPPMVWLGPGEYRIPRSPDELWTFTNRTPLDPLCLARLAGVPPPSTSVATSSPDCPDQIVPDTAIRLGTDGGTSAFTVDGGLFQVYSGGGSVWAFVYLPGEEIRIDPELAHPVRIDPTTGEYLVRLDALPGSFSTSFLAYVNADGMLAVSDRERAWWVHNDGTSERLAPLLFDIVGITASQYVARNDDGTVSVGSLAALPRLT